MLRIISLLLFLSITVSTQARRGVWFTNVNSKIYDSRENIDRALKLVKKLGMDSVYPVVWNKSQAFFQSKAIAELFGEDAVSAYDGRDILQEFVELGKVHGLEVVPWFEYGLKIPYATLADGKKEILPSARALEEMDMLSRDRKGNVEGPCEFGVCKAFLNPAHPRVQDFLVEVFQELSSYDVAGVQIDDHFSLHRDFGYDRYMKSQYEEEFSAKGDSQDEGQFNENGLQGAFESINEMVSNIFQPRPKFEDWRKTQVTNLVYLISDTVRSNAKRFILSPGGDNDFSKNKWQQDWLEMSRSGALDEIIVQVYRYSMDGFKATLNHPSLREAARYQPLGVAVLTGLRGNTRVSGGDIYLQTREAEKQGYEVSYFYYDSIVRAAKGKETKAQRVSSLVKSRDVFLSRK